MLCHLCWILVYHKKRLSHLMVFCMSFFSLRILYCYLNSLVCFQRYRQNLTQFKLSLKTEFSVWLRYLYTRNPALIHQSKSSVTVLPCCVLPVCLYSDWLPFSSSPAVLRSLCCLVLPYGVDAVCKSMKTLLSRAVKQPKLGVRWSQI